MRREGLGMEECENDAFKRRRRVKETAALGKKISDFLHGLRIGKASATFRKKKFGEDSTLE